MRYIIETALLHGAILNRTVILPSFVYARSCEYDIEVCAAYAEMVDHGDATGTNEWKKLPIKEQMAWRVPISVMLNLTLLRNAQPVITVAEYLRLHNMSEETEANDGNWQRHMYPQSPYVFDATRRKPTLQVIENNWYDPHGINRVDMIPEAMKRRGLESRGWRSPERRDRALGGHTRNIRACCTPGCTPSLAEGARLRSGR
jgi:hypothetical protein